MTIDAISLTAKMTDAASKAAAACWPAIRILGESELRRLAGTLEDVHRLYAAGVIEEDEAFNIADLHRGTAIAVLRSTQCIGERSARVVAHKTMKAAVAAAREIVNPVVGFPLL
jgi:hypothetical protein